MAGTWEIQNAVVIDSNSTAPVPPLNGTAFVIEPGKVVSIGGLPVDPESLTLLLGAPLDSYVNQVDDRTLFYGLVVDRRAAGQTREEIAVAGGSIDENTISVEAFSSSQSPSASEAIYTVSRYQLVRSAPSAPAMMEPATEPRSVQSLLRDAFGSR